METSFVLLKYVGKALLPLFPGGVVVELFADVLPDLAKNAWNWWSREKNEEERQAELQALAQAGASDVAQQIAQIVREIGADLPVAVRQVLAGYLAQVPASVRRSLRRATDPTGVTVPAGLVLRKADDLLTYLPTRLPRFRPGDRPLADTDWELVDLLGVGGFGEVWKARNIHRPEARPVALKFCTDAVAATTLRNEVALLDWVAKQGKHAGIVQLLHTYLSAETPCLEYEYVEGGDLAGLIQEWHRSPGGPDPRQAARVVWRLAQIVGYAHRLNPPIVHRDLKPANILVQKGEDGRPQFKVTDFGIGGLAARRTLKEQTRGLTSRGHVLVTAARGAYTLLYASPQQIRGDAPDPRDDVYALGVIWHQLLTGDLGTGRPGGDRWRDRLTQRGMAPALVKLLARCFEDDPADRLDDAHVLAVKLEDLLDEEDIPEVKPVHSPERRQVRRLAPLVIVALIVAVGFPFVIVSVLLAALLSLSPAPTRTAPTGSGKRAPEGPSFPRGGSGEPSKDSRPPYYDEKPNWTKP